MTQDDLGNIKNIVVVKNSNKIQAVWWNSTNSLFETSKVFLLKTEKP